MKNDNIYQMVTDRIIAEMEKGIIPWQKPWNGGECCISHTTGKPYSWLNQLMLGGRVGEWLTFKQCKAGMREGVPQLGRLSARMVEGVEQ